MRTLMGTVCCCALVHTAQYHLKQTDASPLVPALDQTFVKAAAVFGTFFGQIIFGILGDKFGRKSVSIVFCMVSLTPHRYTEYL